MCSLTTSSSHLLSPLFCFDLRFHLFLQILLLVDKIMISLYFLYSLNMMFLSLNFMEQRKTNDAEIESFREEYHQRVSTLERKVCS